MCQCILPISQKLLLLLYNPPLPLATIFPLHLPCLPLLLSQLLSKIPFLFPQKSQLPRNTGHQLVGVLESGERSTAIFTFNGMSRRFEIGEAVGSSGGILMGVQNQQAVIYHNGQTKYVDVGQGF